MPPPKPRVSNAELGAALRRLVADCNRCRFAAHWDCHDCESAHARHGMKEAEAEARRAKEGT
jgi:hypothetical protein